MVSTLNAATIILGFTGSLGSGCTYISKGLSDQYKIEYFSLSNVLREILKENGAKASALKNVDYLQTKGNEIRYEKKENGFLAAELITRIENQK